MNTTDENEHDLELPNMEDGSSSDIFQDVSGGGASDQDENNEFKTDGDYEEEENFEDQETVEEQNELEFSDFADSEEDIDENEIDLLLEEGLSKSKRAEDRSEAAPKEQRKAPEKPNDLNGELTIKKIVVLEEKGGNTFEVLPGGWLQIRHSSGLPLYLHRKSRVCSLAKPYFLGTASVRRHSIPLSAIPCLAYRRALEKEERDKELLEEQARELESQHAMEADPYENIEAPNLLAKCLNVSSSKDPTVKTASVSDKVQRFKRRIELEKESVDSQKRGKLSDGKLAQDETESAAKELSCNKDQVSGQEGVNGESGGGGGTGGKSKGGKDQLRPFIPLAKVETARENAHLYSITPLDLRQYCQSLFRFMEVECKRFKTWSARRRHTKEQKRKQLERPRLPDNAQVIKFFDISACKGGEEQMVKKFNDYVFNPNGKSSVCILHEFVQHALRKQPTYSFEELENAATPYSARVMINDVPYGSGFGSSKKAAKAEAAKATLEILIPQMKGHLDGGRTDPSSDFDITEYFQQVEMNDVRIPKMCTSVSEPSPYTLLLTCLQRNFGQNGTSNVQFDMVPVDAAKGNLPNQFRMTAGNQSVVVTASNKREGKQLASQLLLSEIHPHITNFGAFIKMYGNGSIKSVKEKKQEEQQITTLQSKASANSPNWAILNKLRQEMLKLADHDGERKMGDSKTYDFPIPSPSTNSDATSSSSDLGKCPFAASKLMGGSETSTPSTVTSATFLKEAAEGSSDSVEVSAID